MKFMLLPIIHLSFNSKLLLKSVLVVQLPLLQRVFLVVVDHGLGNIVEAMTTSGP
jgi:hypothetical protein